MGDNNVKIKETLTFYRKMANTHPSIMKKYKSAVINKMNYKDILRIYNENNLNFKKDIDRLKFFMINHKFPDKLEIIMENPVNKLNDTYNSITNEITNSDEEPNEISSESSEAMSEPIELDESTIYSKFILIKNNLLEKTEGLSKNIHLLIIIPILITGILYARRNKN
jgi:hypothetical protein